MEKTFLEVQGIGRCELVQNCGQEFIVEDESGCRQRIAASLCVGYTTDEAGEVSGAICPTAADTVSDQFTGADLGAEMAAAESAPDALAALYGLFNEFGEFVYDLVAVEVARAVVQSDRVAKAKAAGV